MEMCKILNIKAQVFRLLFIKLNQRTNPATKMTHQILPGHPRKKNLIRVHIKSLARHEAGWPVLTCREWSPLQRQKRSRAIITRQGCAAPLMPRSDSARLFQLPRAPLETGFTLIGSKAQPTTSSSSSPGMVISTPL